MNPLEAEITFPDFEAKDRLGQLVGLDEQKERLSRLLGLLVNPEKLKRWGERHHPDSSRLLNIILQRPPLVVLAGDVGSGKTELAETIGDLVARQEGIDIVLLPLSLNSRGRGRVGEMTQLLTAAFDQAIQRARPLKSSEGTNRGAVILLIDEADALAQSREAAQMHHEDRAGVNAFIRGVDRLGRSRLPVAAIMCTNRLQAFDPAIRRRAADILEFRRPSEEQRLAILGESLSCLGFSAEDIGLIVDATGRSDDRAYGFTSSDLIQRLIPSIVLDAFPENPVCTTRGIEIARSMEPTPPFREEQE